MKKTTNKFVLGEPTSAREKELFGILQEESAEVIQVISKMNRFGKIAGTYNNLKHLEQEVGDVLAVLKLLTDEGFLDASNIMKDAERKLVKLEQYMVNKRSD